MPLIINKDNQDHKPRAQKKYYIVLEQKPRMYLCEAGTFIPEKKFALGIINTAVAKVALDKINAMRKIESIVKPYAFPSRKRDA